MSLFHAGEIEIQRRLGVRQEAESVGEIIAGAIPADIGPLLAVQRMAVAATVDAEGRPWASLLTGPEGFVAAADEHLLHLAQPRGLDALVRANLGARPDLGLLVLDPRTRRRLRFNGRGLLAPEGLFLLVDQVYGNCRKYIRKRRIVSESDASPGEPAGSRTLTPRQQRLVAEADTFFLATWSADGGADASHRGGPPGFVAVSADTLEFSDYPGNNMFNSLGNIARHPRAGLLFADFGTGDLVQITGSARLVGEGRPALRIGIEAVRETRGGSALRFAPEE
jgi:predicted pyridoxine 5'-phosphate oxidase superfamily flavin-nucleotide-binding protein